MNDAPRIHPSAVIHPDAQLADDVRVGPFTTIGPHVVIGAGTWVGSHVVLNGHTRIGQNNQIFQFSSIGEEPQHRAYQGEPTRVEIGDDNVFRENCTVHRGTMIDRGLTKIGSHNLLMAYVHIAHDCVLADHIVMANGVSLAGHVLIEEHCLFGGFALVHQFCRVGRFAFLGHATGATRDVPPFVRCAGYTSKPYGINRVGMQRVGFEPERIAQVKALYKILYRSNLRLVEAKGKLAELAATQSHAKEFLDFLGGSKRGIIR